MDPDKTSAATPPITREVAMHRAAGNLRLAEREMNSLRGNSELANVRAQIGAAYANLAAVLPPTPGGEE